MPTGRLSVSETLVTVLGDVTGLTRSMVRRDGWPAETLTGLKLLLTAMATVVSLPSVAFTAAVFCAPSAVVMLPTGRLFGQFVGLPLVLTLNRSVAVAAGGERARRSS